MLKDLKRYLGREKRKMKDIHCIGEKVPEFLSEQKIVQDWFNLPTVLPSLNVSIISSGSIK